MDKKYLFAITFKKNPINLTGLLVVASGLKDAVDLIGKYYQNVNISTIKNITVLCESHHFSSDSSTRIVESFQFEKWS